MRKPLYTAIIAALMSAPLLAGGAGAKHAELDKDGDGVVTRTEFETYLEKKDLYSSVDLDQDGYIAEEEFDAMEIQFDEDQSLSEWDMDDNNYLSATEFRDGLYDAFDENENGHWDNGEWDDAGDAGLFDV